MNNLNIECFVEWYDKYKKDLDEHKKDGHNFNVFKLLKDECNLKIDELMHSGLIRFLLEPNSLHGCNKLFLEEFLKILKVDSPQTGEWKVYTEVGKIDILLKREDPLSIIVIENKANWAVDQKNQLYRYWYNAIYRETKEVDKNFYEKKCNNFKICYLVPIKSKNYSEQSISRPEEDKKTLSDKIPMNIDIISFDKEILEWLDSCIKKLPEENYRLRDYIEQYKMLCKSLSKGEVTMGEQLLEKAMNLFDSIEKWNSFCELPKQVDTINREWWKRLLKEIETIYNQNKNDEWEISFKGNRIEWFLKVYEQGFITIICYDYDGSLNINYDENILDIKCVKNILNQEDNLNKIKKCFYYPVDNPTGTNIALENHNYGFISKNNEKLNSSQLNQLAWYAGNKTEDFANKILNVVKRLQSPEMTELFREINDKCFIG